MYKQYYILEKVDSTIKEELTLERALEKLGKIKDWNKYYQENFKKWYDNERLIEKVEESKTLFEKPSIDLDDERISIKDQLWRESLQIIEKYGDPNAFIANYQNYTI